MTFNRIIKYIYLIMLSLVLNSCSEFLNGKAKKEVVLEIKQESMSCLQNVSLDLKKFMKSESTNEDIDKTFNCFDTILKEFQTRAEGGIEAEAFTNEELFTIFDKFINDAKISKSATSDLMLLKSAILGGSAEKITKTEITQLRDYLLVLKVEAKKLISYAHLFTFTKGEARPSKEIIKNGFLQLSLSLKNLFKASKISNSNYKLSDLKNLISNLNLIKNDSSDLMVLADKVHALIAGGHDISSNEDRGLYLDNLTEILRLYSVQLNGYVKFEIENSEQINDTFEYVFSFVNLLENSVQYKKTKIISFETIDPLLTEALKKDILPIKMSAETALNFYKTLIVRIFETGLSGDVKSFVGLKRVHFLNLKRELAIYKLYSDFIIELTSVSKIPNLAHFKISEVQNQLKAYQFSLNKEVLSQFSQEMQEQILVSVNELREEFLDKTPTVYKFNKLILAANQEEWSQNWEDLQRGLYYTMLSRQLILGWGESHQVKEVKSAHINEKGLIQWYAEFKKFGIETKSFDPRAKNSGASNLLSANLFTRSGNGDDKMDFKESIQFLGILFSGGGRTYEHMAEGFKEAKCNLPELDVFDHHLNNEACVYNNLKNNYKLYFLNLPYLKLYLDQLVNMDTELIKLGQNEKAIHFKTFYDSLMVVVRFEDDSKNGLETAHLRSMGTVLYYVESLFAAYDADKNGLLSELEIKATYPKFKTFAEKFAKKSAAAEIETFNSWMGRIAGYRCFTEQDLIKESFVFLIYNGKTPSKSDLTLLPCLRNEPLIKFKGEVTHKHIINTFKIIKAVLD